MTHVTGRLCYHYCRDCWRETQPIKFRRSSPTRTPRPAKPKPRKRFKPGERGKRRGIVYE